MTRTLRRLRMCLQWMTPCSWKQHHEKKFQIMFSKEEKKASYKIAY